MKELSIQEKARAYDEALERAKKWYNEEEPDSYTCIVESIFPELKGSDDERIRKNLIGYIKGISKNEVCEETKDSWIAWLEKQGEHANFRNKIQIGDKVTHNEDGVLVNLSQMNRVVEEYNIRRIGSKHAEGKLAEKNKELNDMLGKQGEQKPADYEPKFHEGEWVVINGLVLKIQEVHNDLYDTTLQNGELRIYDTYILDNDAHLWTIQDAKDGDVLTYSDSRHTWLCIFKELKNQRCYDYCSYRNKDEVGFWPISNWNYDKVLSYKPATKEQRDTLMKAMADAGYTFDFDKKELRKIEQKPAEWSEEYEYIINHLLAICAGAKKYRQFAGCSQDEITKYQTWLKSLKERALPQPKQELSKQDAKL